MNKRKRNDDELTEREIEVLNLISKKMNDYEIGEKLCISHHTAHSHRKKIYKKFAAHSDLEAVLVGIERGYIKFTQ